MKIKIVNYNNINNFTKDRLIIMSNHYIAIDYFPIAQIFNNLNKNPDKKLYTVINSKLLNENNKDVLSKSLGLFDKKFYKYSNCIEYTRGDKESGKIVRKNIIDTINNNNVILLFPEGIITRKGIPESFKPGSFEICKENSISILPLTIKYNKNIGLNENEKDKVDFKKWFNVEATIYVHDIITPDSCINANDMMQKTFNIIRSPLI
jgi:1-acyl-sn-glycerol-3-phosphate acyltransferase